ncbi:MAG: hypothetical protein COB59_11905 [Rhodospirillaceae bacterium]|nr:MAG: hypothetical protein COB59_11905 [Rhodospirillaceae bacterium]
MSLYGALFSGVSGLTAQSSAMGAISDNITNVSTIGYKGTTVNFQTLVTKQTSSTFYSAGGVQSKPRQSTDVQGLLQASTSSTDVALSGGGFFVVNQANTPGISDPYLYTRAGSFIQDDQGFLKNSAGYYLQGWPTDAAGTVVPSSAALTVTNQNIISTDYLESINLNRVGGTAAATSNVAVGANLPSSSGTGDTFKTDVQYFNSLGNANNISINYVKTATSNEWDLSVKPPPGTAVATLYDNQSPKGVYSSTGLIEFTAIPAANSTIKIGFTSATAQTYTFVNGTAGANQIQVDGNQTLSQVVAALVAEVKAKDKAFSVDSTRIAVKSGVTTALEFTESGVGDIYVDLSSTLNATGAPVSNQTGTFTVKQQDNLYSDFTMLRFGGGAFGAADGAVLPNDNDTFTVNGITYGFDMSGDGTVTSGTVISPGTAQVDTVTINGTVDIGDVFSVTVAGATYNFTATDTSSSTVATQLAALINANTTVGAVATGSAIAITSSVIGTAFASPSALSATSFAPAGVSTIGVTGTTAADGTNPATQDITIAGTIDAGDVFTLTPVDTGATLTGFTAGTMTYTAQAGDTATSVAAGLVASITGNAGYTVANVAGVITMTSTSILNTESFNATPTALTVAAATATANTAPSTTATTANVAISLSSLLAAIETTIEATDTVMATTGLRVQTFDINNDGGVDTLYISSVTNDTNDIDTSGITALARPVDADGTAYASTTIAVATAAGITFNADGLPSGFNVSELEILNYADGANNMSNATGEGNRVTLDFGTTLEANGLTQFGAAFTPAFITQNGSKFGTFAGVTIGQDGLVTALFDNGETRKIFKIPVATFVNPNQLESRSGNVWSATQNSGDYTLRVADSGAAGQVVQSALEASTVDIGAEFTNMIVVQRAYSASTKIISTADQMLEELMRVKR